jgi:hypothetical protein
MICEQLGVADVAAERFDESILRDLIPLAL